MDAGYTSIEAQKSKGSLHAHSQFFVQCLHQHTPLVEILQRLKVNGAEVVKRYLLYKEHVCRQVYLDAEIAEQALPLVEKTWPEYKDNEDACRF